MKASRHLIGLAALLASGPAFAQFTDGVVRIGVLTDMSSLYSDIGGPGSVAAAKLAVADSGAAAKGIKVEIISGDHQNKSDVGAGLAGSWFDVNKVDMIVDVPNSGVALAVSEVARQKNKVFLVSGAATSDLTGPKCNANTIHWTYDTWNLANATGKAMVKTGGDTWYFITADYAFGQALERDTGAVVQANGGKVLGRVRVPLNTNDFSSFLLQAQASRAKVIGLANAGGDTINSIKQAAEFGIVRGGQSLAGLLVFASDVAALGLPTAQGLVLTETWYWDMNDANRAWTKRWQAERPGKIPGNGHRRRLFVDPALSQGRRGPEGRRRRQGGGGQDEGTADRRSAVRQGHHPGRRAQAARCLSFRGEEAGRVEIPRRLLQDSRHDPRRGSLPPAEGRRLPAGAGLRMTAAPADAPRAAAPHDLAAADRVSPPREVGRAGVATVLTAERPDWLDRGMPHIWLPYAQMKNAGDPLPVVATHGSRIVLADGRELIDGIASWWTACHGYNHPHIAAAVRRQLDRMPHVMFGGLAHEPALTLARRLAALMPAGLTRVFFSDSGSVAVEVAMKMAVQYWLNNGVPERKRFLAFNGAYHGDTTGAMAVSDPVDGMHSAFGALLPRHLFADLPRDDAQMAQLTAPDGAACRRDRRHYS